MPTTVDEGKFNLLGLGDIILPGLFIALLLRFDASNAKNEMKESAMLSFRKPFFNHGIISYAVGLGIVIWLMRYMQMAQVRSMIFIFFILSSNLNYLIV